MDVIKWNDIKVVCIDPLLLYTSNSGQPLTVNAKDIVEDSEYNVNTERKIIIYYQPVVKTDMLLTRNSRNTPTQNIHVKKIHVKSLPPNGITWWKRC